MNSSNQKYVSATGKDLEKDKLEIRIEGRVFSLRLDNLNNMCVKELESIFSQGEQSLEELLTMCIGLVREKSILRIKSNELLKQYEEYIDLQG